MGAWAAEMRGRQSRFGYLLALVAVCLQLAAPVLLAPQVSSAGQDEFAEFLRLYTLCLGGDPTPNRPATTEQDRPDQIVIKSQFVRFASYLPERGAIYR
jgi:hypothetical protein